MRTVNTKCASDNAMHVLKDYPHTSVFRGLVSSYLKVNIRIVKSTWQDNLSHRHDNIYLL